MNADTETMDAQPPRSERRGKDPLWFRLLDRFGLPTMFAVLLLAFVLRASEADRTERRELLTAIKDAIGRQTLALEDLALREKEHADAIRLTWPRVRELPHQPARAPAAPAREKETTP